MPNIVGVDFALGEVHARMVAMGYKGICKELGRLRLSVMETVRGKRRIGGLLQSAVEVTESMAEPQSIFNLHQKGRAEARRQGRSTG